VTTTLVLTLAVLGTVALAAFSVLIVRRLVRRHVAEGHNDVLVPIFLTAGTIYAVFLAFLVVAVWESYDAAHDNAAAEASSLATLYRASTGMEKVSGDEMRRLVREYTEAVINDEWKVQAATGAASPRARTAALGMYRLFGHLTPQVRQSDALIDQAALQLIGQIQTERNKRTLQAGESLPAIMWLGSIGSGGLVLLLSCFLYMDRAWPQVLVVGVMTTMIATLLCITFVLSRPFVGPMALQPEGFEHSLSVYDSVDKTP
jgi:Protein of unknown function (DUF4239)